MIVKCMITKKYDDKISRKNLSDKIHKNNDN